MLFATQKRGTLCFTALSAPQERGTLCFTALSATTGQRSQTRRLPHRLPGKAKAKHWWNTGGTLGNTRSKSWRTLVEHWGTRGQKAGRHFGAKATANLKLKLSQRAGAWNTVFYGTFGTPGAWNTVFYHTFGHHRSEVANLTPTP